MRSVHKYIIKKNYNKNERNDTNRDGKKVVKKNEELTRRLKRRKTKVSDPPDGADDVSRMLTSCFLLNMT